MCLDLIIKLGVNVIVKWLLLFAWIFLFILGVTNYTGSFLHYTVFSFVFLAMLISGFYRQVSYGYLFLVVMLWLGFWLKLTVHFLVDYPFGEGTGAFDGTPAAWDTILLIAIAGAIGVLATRITYSFFNASSTMQAKSRVFKAPFWYPVVRRWIWAALMITCVGLIFVNTYLGILQVGLAPKTILLWPLNSLISFLVGYGLTFCIATLLWWDISLRCNISLVVHFVLLEAFFSSISIFSRGAYIFHAIPQLLGVYKNRLLVSDWSMKKVIVVATTFVVLFVISNPVVNTLRGYYYSNAPLELASASASAFVRFAVDRWVGAEGVMVVSAYPKKGVDLFADSIMETREIGKDTFYSEISRPVYFGVVDKSKFQFSEIPGAIAFLYYTGQLWVVLFGMIVFTFAVLASEMLIFRLTSNPLLSALWGGATANAVAQFGIAPRSHLFYFFELACGVIAIYFIQSKFFASSLQKLNTFIKLKVKFAND